MKMYFSFQERFAGKGAFAKGKPAVMVVGDVKEPIDAKGDEVFMIGSCAKATVTSAKRVSRIDNCYATAVELGLIIRRRLGIPTPLFAPSFILPFIGGVLTASFMKLVKLRYLQDMGHFLKHGLVKRL
jgi:hypothetical protein